MREYSTATWDEIANECGCGVSFRGLFSLFASVWLQFSFAVSFRFFFYSILFIVILSLLLLKGGGNATQKKIQLKQNHVLDVQ